MVIQCWLYGDLPRVYWKLNGISINDKILNLQVWSKLASPGKTRTGTMNLPPLCSCEIAKVQSVVLHFFFGIWISLDFCEGCEGYKPCFTNDLCGCFQPGLHPVMTVLREWQAQRLPRKKTSSFWFPKMDWIVVYEGFHKMRVPQKMDGL